MNISKGHIYYIFYNLNPHILYIGSTFNELKHRWRGHKVEYKYHKSEISIYEYFDKYGIENFTMKLLKSYDVYREHNKDAKHLKAYEQLWINKLKCVNKRPAFQPLKKQEKKKYYKEYGQRPEVKEKKREQRRLRYCKENKEKLSEKQKEYNKKNKEQIAQYNKEWREKNKEQIAQYNKEWREKNKEKIKDYYIKRKEEKNKL